MNRGCLLTPVKTLYVFSHVLINGWTPVPFRDKLTSSLQVPMTNVVMETLEYLLAVGSQRDDANNLNCTAENLDSQTRKFLALVFMRDFLRSSSPTGTLPCMYDIISRQDCSRFSEEQTGVVIVRSNSPSS